MPREPIGYPSNTVPLKVEQLFQGQLFHDRRQREARLNLLPDQLARTPYIDYLRLIVADADTGRGGLTAVPKLTKMFVEKGAVGIHIKALVTKKCEHMGGKVLVPIQEHINHPTAIRHHGRREPSGSAYRLGSRNCKSIPTLRARSCLRPRLDNP